jgi:glycosyltransferase involved in cell wall biosynthesis
MAEHLPLISVDMSVYNSDQFLSEAIESVLHQTLQDFEFIIVDDASKDASLQILENYQKKDNRIHILRNEINSGLGSSLQRGIDASRGRFIARMDADDISLPERFEKQINFLFKHPEIKILGSGVLIVDEKGEKVSQVKFSGTPSILRWNMLLGSGMIVSHPSVLMEHDFIINLRGYSSLRAAQDFELWTRTLWLNPFPIANLDDYLLAYRQHVKSTSSANNTLQESTAIQIRLEKISQFLEKPVPAEVVLAYRHPTYSYSNIEECIRLWIELYCKFIDKFNVNKEERRLIESEILPLLNKYSYIPPQKNNIQFRVSFWKIIRLLPRGLAFRALFSKITWGMQRL